MPELLRSLEALTAGPSPGAPLGVHTLLCRRHLMHYLFAIKTLLGFGRLAAEVLIYDDGTLGADGTRLIEGELPGARVVPVAAWRATAGLGPRARRFLAGHVLAAKLFGPWRFGTGEQIVVLDSDVLFLAPPEEIVAWAEGRGGSATLYAGDASRDRSVVLDDEAFARLGARRPPGFNSGVLCVRRDLLEPDAIEACLAEIEARNGRDGSWLVEQTVWATLVGRHSFRRLPARYFMHGLDNRGARVDPARRVAIHYSVDKARFFTEGVRFLRESGRLGA